MKTTFTVLILIALATSFLTAQTQDKQEPMDHHKHMQVMLMLKDSSMMDMMMSNVAANRQMRLKMMEKMAEYTEGDTASMQELCKVMMKGNNTHSMEETTGCGMMKHEKMQGKTNEMGKGKQEKEGQDKPHKH